MSTIDLRALAGGGHPGAGSSRPDLPTFLVDVANANCNGVLLVAQGYALTQYDEALVPEAFYRSYIPQRCTLPPLRVPHPPGILLPVSRALVHIAPDQERTKLWHEMLDHLAEALALASWPAAPAQLSLSASAECVYQDVAGVMTSAFQCNQIVYRLVLVQP